MTDKNGKDNDSAFNLAILSMNRTNIQDNKRQQWQITGYYLGICGFAIAYCKYVNFEMTTLEKGICLLIPFLAMIAATMILMNLQGSSERNRDEIIKIINNDFKDSYDKIKTDKKEHQSTNLYILGVLLLTIFVGYFSSALIIITKVHPANYTERQISTTTQLTSDTIHSEARKQLTERQKDSTKTTH